VVLTAEKVELAKHEASETGDSPQREVAETVVIHRPPTVEVIVDDQAFYVNVCEEQSAVFRQNVEEFTKEYTLYSQSADVVRTGSPQQITKTRLLPR
jgi:hypothetical protein